MQLDVSAPLIGYTGQPLVEGDARLILREIACNALAAVIPGETLSGVQKIERMALAKRIWRSGTLEPGPLSLSAEEIVLLKAVINAVYLSPVVVAAAWDVLDP